MSNDMEHTGGDEVAPEELVRRFQGGEEAAFDDLMRRFQRQMYNLAYRMLDNGEEANDLTQEIFIKVYRSIAKFRGESSFSTWLHAVALNLCRNRRRQLRRLSEFEAVSLDNPGHGETDGLPMQMAAPDTPPDKMLERTEIRHLVERTVAGLPEDFAAVVVMRDIQDMSYEEIAAALDCSMGTVKSRLSRGRLMVAEKLKRIYRR
jgi:RNA polymerase sigma-70 factor (ECF subfamily)